MTKTAVRTAGPVVILSLMIVAYALTFGVMSVRRHVALQTHVFDVGNVDQTLWNTIHGRPLHFTTQPTVGDNRLGMHVEPILFGVALTYLVYPDPRGLLVLQTIVLALGAVPLYAIARRRLGARWVALAFPFAYLMLPALQAANLFEFHAVTFAPPLLLACFYFLDRAAPPAGSETIASGGRRDWVLYGLFLFLALTCKEDISLLVILLGLYIALFRRRVLAGVLTTVTGVAWFTVAVYVVIPHFRPAGSPFLDFYQGLGQTPLAIAWTLLTQPKAVETYILTPENGRALLAFLMPLGALPVFGLPFWLLTAPSFGISFVSNNPLMHRMERYHYGAPMIAVTLVAAVYGVAWLSRIAGRREAWRRALVAALAVWLVAASLGYGYLRGFAPFARSFDWPQVTPHEQLIDQAASVVPASAVVSVQANLFPHFSQRETAYFWPDPRPKDYVVLDVSDPTFWNRDDAHEVLKRQLRTDPTFGPILAQDGFLVLKKGAPPRKTLPPEFYTFAKAEHPTIRYPMTVDFGDAVRFLGFTPLYDREDEVRYELYFQALRPLDRDYAVPLYLADAAGNIVGGTDKTQPVLVWYPTSRWQVGETVRVVANTINWWTGDRVEYGVALGVVDGSDVWNPGLRLRPQVKDSRWITPLLSDGSLLQLMRFRRSWDLHYPIEVARQFEAPSVTQRLDARFADKAALTGYDLPSARLKGGETLDLSLVWQAMGECNVSYAVFLHVVGPNGVVAQQDAPPDEGRLPTTSWMRGEYVTDHHHISLPADLPAGRYQLVVGLYDPATGARLPVGGADAQGDQIVLKEELDIVD